MKQVEEKINETVLYDGRILRLHVDDVRLPNGKTSIREVVDHKDGAAVLALKDGCFYFVRQFRYAAGKVMTEIPAGLVEEGEEPYKTAERELQEEIGLKPEKLEFLVTMYPSPGFTDERTSIYFADHFSSHKLKADDDEFIQILKIPVRTAKMLYENGRFEDAKTVCALGYYFSGATGQ